MGEPDLFVSTGQEVEIDSETEAAIDSALRDVDAGRGMPADKVRELLANWISSLSTATKL